MRQEVKNVRAFVHFKKGIMSLSRILEQDRFLFVYVWPWIGMGSIFGYSIPSRMALLDACASTLAFQVLKEAVKLRLNSRARLRILIRTGAVPDCESSKMIVR
jgi:hypothetical protein